MNRSIQRDTVLNILRSTTSHPTAEWVYEKSREVMPNISLGTVYRNLNQLVESGEIIRVPGNFDKERFDGNPIRHVHFVCDACNAVLDIGIDRVLDDKLMTIFTDCKVDNYNLVYNGLCGACKPKSNANHIDSGQERQ